MQNREKTFIDGMIINTARIWDSTEIHKHNLRSAPDNILGHNGSLLRLDIEEQFGSWFIEGIADPMRYVMSQMQYPHIVSDVKKVINSFFSYKSQPERNELVKSIAETIWLRVRNLRAEKRRNSASLEMRNLLLDLAGYKPRCWVCGYEFTDEAIESFRTVASCIIPQPQFLDILKPSGLRSDDLRIEVDHVMPLSIGGEEGDNLRIACGWCNRNKSSLQTIYEVKGAPAKAGPNNLSISSLPQKFWIVRLLGLSTTCEYLGGCSATTKTHELTVCSRNNYGALNPNNLQVTCHQHHPLGSNRLQPRAVVAKLWGLAGSE